MRQADVALTDDREGVDGGRRCGCSRCIHDVNQVWWNGLKDKDRAEAPRCRTSTTANPAGTAIGTCQTLQPPTTCHKVSQ